MKKRPLLTLGFLVAALVVVSVTFSVQQAMRGEAATVGQGTMQLQATGSGVTCDNATNPTKCTVPLSGAFALNVAVTDIPPEPVGGNGDGYTAMATDITYGSLTYTPTASAADEIVLPDASAEVRTSPEASRYQHGALGPSFGGVTTFKGVVLTLAMTCTSTDLTQKIDLIPIDPSTNPLGSVLVGSDQTTQVAQTDSLTINCGAGASEATATNTPEGPTETPGGDTPTPTNTPEGGEPTATSTSAPPTATATEPAEEPGDANCNGQTNSIDASLVLQLDAGLITSVGCPDAADVNQNGTINSIDASLILQIDAGLLVL